MYIHVTICLIINQKLKLKNANTEQGLIDLCYESKETKNNIPANMA